MAARQAVHGVALVSVAMAVALVTGAAAAGTAASCGGLAATIVASPGSGPIEGTEGADVIVGSDGADLIRGNGGDDTICGGGGADALAGGDGRDVLIGGAGDDSFVGGRGDDAIRGGAGVDTVSYEGAPGAVQVDLDSGEVGGADGRDVIAGVESVIGSRFGDRLLGTRGRNVLDGSAGNDVLEGRGGSDELNGGLGDDSLAGGPGPDTLDGGSGSDEASYAGAPKGVELVGRTGRGFGVTGGDGPDELVSIEAIVGSGFDDELDTEGTSVVRAEGGAGNDTIHARTAVGGPGKDTLMGNVVDGGPGGDILWGDYLRDGGRADGGSGADGLFFHFALPVEVDLEQGTVRIHFSRPVEATVRGVEGVAGGFGDDVLRAGKGNQFLAGREGDDLLWGGPGNDQLDGGPGSDTVSYENARGAVDVDLAAGRATGAHGTDKLAHIENVIGGPRRDRIAGNNGPNVLRGGFGADRLYGRGGNDLIFGEGSRDLANGGLGKDRCDAEIRISCELSIAAGKPPEEKPAPPKPQPLYWSVATVDVSRANRRVCGADCATSRAEGAMTRAGSYVQTGVQPKERGNPDAGTLVTKFTLAFTPPPTRLVPGQRVTFETAGSATGSVEVGAQRMVFFYRASTPVFAKTRNGPPTGTDSPETVLRLDANRTLSVREAGNTPFFVAPSTGLATFSITAVGLNFSSITWTYKVKVKPSN